jgi:hypothetical protein
VGKYYTQRDGVIRIATQYIIIIIIIIERCANLVVGKDLDISALGTDGQSVRLFWCQAYLASDQIFFFSLYIFRQLQVG